MNKKFWSLLFLACAAIVMATAPFAEAGENGGTGFTMDDPPLIVGADWFATENKPPAFFWGSGVGALNLEGPFTFSAFSPIRLDVTDDFDRGDRFEVFDFGLSIGLTSLVPSGGGGEQGPEAAFNDPRYSSGSFFLGPGNHSITIAAVQNPFNTGRGYLRAFVIPEPHAVTLIVIALSAVQITGRRSKRPVRHARLR